ncbi:MAG: hypothetical protein F6K28_55100 [Microcoleus sp. SIO2G3]|nr:hypothetical protein [Microcoleus sp. SIO2G3]
MTHEIDEALLLGDRVVLMARRPGRIECEWAIAQPKPRFQQAHALADICFTVLEALAAVREAS